MPDEPRIALTPKQIGDLIRGANAPPPTVFQKVLLHTLKVSGDDVRKLAQLFSLAQSVLGAISTITGAIDTVKKALTLLGVLDEPDPMAATNALITAGFRALTDYYQDEKFEEQVTFRGRAYDAVRMAQSAVDELNRSRSQTNWNDAVDRLHDLEAVLGEMLAVANFPNLHSRDLPIKGVIPFSPKAYGYPLPTPAPDLQGSLDWDVPDHWLPYAEPLYMRRLDAGPIGDSPTAGGTPEQLAGIQYSRPEDELRTRIFDPAFFIDALHAGVAQYIALLTAMEPVFRATGYRHGPLRDLADGLTAFADAWHRSLFVTNIDPFLPPPGPDGSSPLQHPFYNPYLPLRARGIPLGVVDPVSGLSTFVPVFNEGFVFGGVAPLTGEIEGTDDRRRVVLNAEESRSRAAALIAESVAGMEAACGIGALRELAAKLVALMRHGVEGSAFSGIVDGRKAAPHRLGIRPPVGWPGGAPGPVDDHIEPVELDLGEIGAKAGKAGKKYTAFRQYDDSVWRFRVPIPRRMDASRIQLGYRLQIVIGSPTVPPANLTLATHNVIASPYLDMGEAIFPTSPDPVRVSAADARIYDVVQSAEFTADDEAKYANGDSRLDKQRLLLNPRRGAVSIEITPSLSIDLDAPGSSFIGHADVEVRNLAESTTEGFVVSVSLIERAQLAYRSYTGDVAQDDDIMAGRVDLLFTPAYLIAPADYFSDREIGLSVVDETITEIPGLVDQIPTDWGAFTDGHEKWLQRLGVDHLRLQIFDQYEAIHPREVAAVVSRVQARHL